VLLSASSRGYYRLPAGALEDPTVRQWLLRAGGQEIMRMQVNPQTFSAFCRELVAAGHALHPRVAQAVRRLVSVRGG
jgi:hypothetical protein